MSDEIFALTAEKQRLARKRDRISRALESDNAAAEPAKPASDEEALKAAQLETGKAVVSGLRDIGVGLTESASISPSRNQLLGGASDAMQNWSGAAHSFRNWLAKSLGPAGGGIVFDPTPRFVGGAELSESESAASMLKAALPDVAPAETVTGGLIRSTAQFLTGFALARTLPGMSAFSAGAPLTASMAQGAVSDFMSFAPQQQNLSNWLQKIPGPQQAVFEALAVNPDDGELINRARHAAEGLGLGLMTEGVIRGLRWIGHGRKAMAAAQPAVEQIDEVAQAQSLKFAELLGPEDAPLFEVRPMKAPTEQVISDVAGATGPKPADAEIFVNWGRIKTHDDVKAVMQQMLDADATAIKAGQRGVVTHAQTLMEAEQIDAWKVLTERRHGQPLGAAEGRAANMLWIRSGEKTLELARLAKTDPSPINQIAFRKMWAVHNAISEQVIPARTETARSLNAWGIPTGGGISHASRMNELSRLLMEDAGDTIDMATRVVSLAEAGKLSAADTFLYGSTWAKGAGMFRQLFYFSLTSGPHTQARNAIGDTIMIPLQLAERKAANLLGKALGNENVPDGETGAMLFGYLEGARNAWRNSYQRHYMKVAAENARLAGDDEAARRILMLPEANIGTVIERTEQPRLGAFASERILARDLDTRAGRVLDKILPKDQSSPFGRFLDMIDSATLTPQRGMGAIDNFYGQMAFDAEMAAQAARKANQQAGEGLITHGELIEQATLLRNSPDEYMKMAATEFRLRSTFQQPLGEVGDRSMKLLSKIPIVGRFVVPFRKTLFNLGYTTFERTPLAPIVGQWNADIRAGGAKADIAMSKVILGTGIMLSMADLARQGVITGVGSDNPHERALNERMGIKPFSVSFPTGDMNEFGEPIYRSFQFPGLDPISPMLGIPASIVEILKHQDFDEEDADMERLITAAAIAIGAQATSGTIMKGLSEFFEFTDPRGRNKQQYIQNMGRIPVPAIVSHIARYQDPNMRIIAGWIDAMKARTPGMSETLPLNPDKWGRPISRASGLGSLYDFISPIYSTTTEKAEPIDRELNRLELYLPPAPKKFSVEGVTLDMRGRPEVWSRFRVLAGNDPTQIIVQGGGSSMSPSFIGTGRGLMDELNLLVTNRHPYSPLYNMLTDGPDGGKAKYIRAIDEAAQDANKEKLMREYPELAAEVRMRRGERQGRYKGIPAF